MMKKLTTLVCLVAMLALAAGASAQTCADIQGATGFGPSPLDGAGVQLSGVVYVAAGTFNGGSVYIQCDDSAAGMTYFDTSSTFAVGDRITLVGDVGAFGCEIQINNFVVAAVGAGTPVSTPIGTQDLTDGTSRMGDFLSVEGLLAKVSGGFNSTYTVDDGSGPAIVFVDGSTGLTEADLDPFVGDIVNICGASKCFNGVGEILPRNLGDIRLVTIANEDASWGSVKSKFE